MLALKYDFKQFPTQSHVEHQSVHANNRNSVKNEKKVITKHNS